MFLEIPSIILINQKMTLQSKLLLSSRAPETQPSAYIQADELWAKAINLGIPCSLVLICAELASKHYHLSILHLLCLIIYYAFLRSHTAHGIHAGLPTLSYVAVSVQTKLAFCSALPPDAG
jgi:hypothetical protein